MLIAQLNTCCFDKTGTLTTSSMKLVSISKNQKEFGEVYIPRKTENQEMIYQIMATCHNIV